MTKALFKKQILEVFSWVYFDRKNGKARSKRGIILYAALYAIVFCSLSVFFSEIARMLCKPLADLGFAWLYFALTGLIAVAMGVFGSVFSTYSSLYTAKDNDFLLSLPVPPSKILMVRLLGVYLMGLMYELIISVPTLIVYFVSVPQTALSVVFCLLLPIILSFFVLTLSCVLGFFVALISSRMKSKNFITVILSLVFIAAYYYVYSQAYRIVQSILAAPDKVGNGIRNIIYPFYLMGRGAEGDALSFLFFTLIVAALFFLTYFVLSKSFLSIATAQRGTAKKEYKERESKVYSIEKALLFKELRRFSSCSIYMLNCGLGTVMMPIAAVLILIKGADLYAVLTTVFGEQSGLIPLLAAAAVCMLSTMNDITSPSVSLEGKNIWLVQSFPIPAKKVLHAKLKLHLLLTVIPTLLLEICILIVFKISLPYAIAVVVFTLIFILLMALIGLALNLKMPNLSWTDATVPVKQSLCVLLALFGGWAMVLAFGGIYLLVIDIITPLLYLIILSLVSAVTSVLLMRWIDTRGAKIFETL